MPVADALRRPDHPQAQPCPRVLVVEDDEVDFRAIRRLLRQVFDGDLNIDWAQTGTDALARMPGTYDVFIVDQFLGGQTGVELIQALRDRMGRCVYILVTGAANPDVDNAAVASGFSSFLTKSSLTAVDLERAIRYGTEATRREEELARHSEELLKAKEALELEVAEHRRTAQQLRETQCRLEAALGTAEESEQRYRLLSEQDLLTGLANRRLFTAILDREIERSCRSGSLLAVLFLDLDRFKTVNDTLGHGVGDRLLANIAGRLSGAIRRTDTAARLGGDEFAVILTNVSCQEAIAGIAKKIVAVMGQPVTVDGRTLTVGTSIGIATSDGGQTTTAGMLRQADVALYQAKGAGGSAFRFFDQDLDRRIQRHKRLESDLSAAVDLGDLFLEYQPKISLASGEVIGAEALSRWTHPDLGNIPPSEFISVAENTGQITSITRFVIETCCRQVARWIDRGDKPVPVAINLSPRDFDNQEIFDMVREATGRFRIDPSLLEIEITEQTMIEGIDRAVQQIDQLKGIGVTVAIDDFGTGFSTFSLAKALPIDKIKLDRSFVHGMLTDRKDYSIAQAVSRLAESLAIVAIAEGIETPEQAAVLSSIGYTEGQGYLFARPTSPCGFESWRGNHSPKKYCLNLKKFNGTTAVRPVSAVTTE